MANFQNVFILLAALLATALAQEEYECRGKPVDLPEKEKAHITDCLSESKIDSIFKIPLEKLSCFGVCILTKKDMLTKDGKINHEKALKFIETHMKEKETQKLLIDATDKCIKEHGELVRIDNDPGCSTFMNVGQCVHDAFFDICIPDKEEQMAKKG